MEYLSCIVVLILAFRMLARASEIINVDVEDLNLKKTPELILGGFVQENEAFRESFCTYGRFK